MQVCNSTYDTCLITRLRFSDKSCNILDWLSIKTIICTSILVWMSECERMLVIAQSYLSTIAKEHRVLSLSFCTVLKWWMFHVPCLFAHLTFIIFIISQVFTCFNIISWSLKIVTPNDSGSKNCLTPAKNVMKKCQIWWSHSWDNKVKINDTMFYCGI